MLVRLAPGMDEMNAKEEPLDMYRLSLLVDTNLVGLLLIHRWQWSPPVFLSPLIAWVLVPPAVLLLPPV